MSTRNGMFSPRVVTTLIVATGKHLLADGWAPKADKKIDSVSVSGRLS